jgi:hypothetical protein
VAFDPVGALQSLQRHGVRFVVIGGVAGRLWGSPTMTNDIDICYDRDPANLERLAGALIDLRARLRGVDEDVPFVLDAVTLAKGQNFTFTTDLGALDVLGLPAGVKDFNGHCCVDVSGPQSGKLARCPRPLPARRLVAPSSPGSASRPM